MTPAQKPLRVFLVAGEESGDRLGAALMRALCRRLGSAVSFSGVGGDHMTQEGLHSLFPLGDAALMGFASIPRRLPTILRRIRHAADAAVAAAPDVVVIIDSPDFTHRVARRVRAAAPSIPIVDYVSPSVWAWRPGRAEAMRAYVDHVLALLPFETDVHRRLGGPPCTYVGHPLSERIAELRPGPEEAGRRASKPPMLLVMPGSRRGEIARMLAPFGETVALTAASVGALEVVVPAVPSLADAVTAEVSRWSVRARVVSHPAEKNAAFRSARAALVKSGTGTLELALAGVPMVAAYRVGAVEAAILRRIIRTPSVILANLVLGENAVPEFLQDDMTPERLSRALAPLLGDTPERERQLAAFAKLDAIMEIGRLVPSERAADIVLNVAREAR